MDNVKIISWVTDLNDKYVMCISIRTPMVHMLSCDTNPRMQWCRSQAVQLTSRPRGTTWTLCVAALLLGWKGDAIWSSPQCAFIGWLNRSDKTGG